MAWMSRQVDLDATQARQALRGRHVFLILAVSTTLAVVAVFGVWTTQQNAPAQPVAPAGQVQPHV